MWNNKPDKVWFGAVVAFLGTLTFTTSSFAAPQAAQCDGSPSHAQLQTALETAVGTLSSGGFGLNMWATAVTRDGSVCGAAFYGQPNDPIAKAYLRALKDSRSANNEQPNGSVAIAFCRALKDSDRSAKTERSNDPIAMAYLMALEDSHSKCQR